MIDSLVQAPLRCPKKYEGVLNKTAFRFRLYYVGRCFRRGSTESWTAIS